MDDDSTLSHRLGIGASSLLGFPLGLLRLSLLGGLALRATALGGGLLGAALRAAALGGSLLGSTTSLGCHDEKLNSIERQEDLRRTHY